MSGLTGMSVDQAVSAQSSMGRAGNEMASQAQVVQAMRGGMNKSFTPEKSRTWKEGVESGQATTESAMFSMGDAAASAMGPDRVDAMAQVTGAAEKAAVAIGGMAAALDLLRNLFGGIGGAGAGAGLIGSLSRFGGLLSRMGGVFGAVAIAGKAIWEIASPEGRDRARSGIAGDIKKQETFGGFMSTIGGNMLSPSQAIAKIAVGGYDSYNAWDEGNKSTIQADAKGATDAAKVTSSQQFVSEMASRGLTVEGKYKSLGIQGAIDAQKVVPTKVLNENAAVFVKRAMALGRNLGTNPLAVAKHAIYTDIVSGRNPMATIEAWEKAASSVTMQGNNQGGAVEVPGAAAGAGSNPVITGDWQTQASPESQISQATTPTSVVGTSASSPVQTGSTLTDVHRAILDLIRTVKNGASAPELVGLS